jgi:hypothetical protein
MSRDFRNFSGLLLERPSKAIQRSDLTSAAEFKYGGTIGGSAWENYTFDSPVPLHGEEPMLSRPPFQYPLVCRRSGTRLLALSLNRGIVEHLLETGFYGALARLKRVSIGVDQLVKSLATKPTDYALSFAHARVPAFGASLRAVSYYGEDLAEAALFRDQLALMVFFTCGLREAKASSEIVRLGADGQVSFLLNHQRRVIEVERALSFLREEGYLTSDFWAEEG